MENFLKSNRLSLWGIVLALMIFITVWLIGSFLFYLLESISGIQNATLQAIFKDVLVPFVGGCVAMVCVVSWIQKVNIRFVFIGFTVIIIILTWISFGLLIPGKIAPDLWWKLFTMPSIIVSIAGAYVYALYAKPHS